MTQPNASPTGDRLRAFTAWRGAAARCQQRGSSGCFAQVPTRTLLARSTLPHDLQNDSRCGGPAHVHNYHCQRVAGLVRVGFVMALGWVLGTWVMEWLLGMVWRGRPPGTREL
jgi:hypothetical protein